MDAVLDVSYQLQQALEAFFFKSRYVFADYLQFFSRCGCYAPWADDGFSLEP